MTLADKRHQLREAFAGTRNAQDRLAALVARGRQQPPLPAEWKRHEFLVPGCASRLWLVPGAANGLCFFRCDSDSAVVKGLAAFFCDYFGGHSPADILADGTDLLAMLNLSGQLPQNRRDGLGRLVERMRQFARECAGAGSVPAQGAAGGNPA